MSVEFEGLEGVLQALADMEDEQRIKAALGKACALVERTAKQKAPKGDGALRNSIASRIEGTEGIVYTALEYAPYVEYGTGLFAEDGGRQDVPWVYRDDKGEYHTTSGRNPMPYMRPALNENRENITRILGEGLKND